MLGAPVSSAGQTRAGVAELSSALAASYFRASPGTLPQVTLARLSDWMDWAECCTRARGARRRWRCSFLTGARSWFSKLSVDEARILVVCGRAVRPVVRSSVPLLSIAAVSLDPLTGEDRAAFLTFAEALASTGWADARSYLEKGPGLLANIQQMQRGRFLTLSRELARREGRQAFTFFAEAARALSKVDPDSHGLLLSLAEDLVVRSPLAAMEFLKTASGVLDRIPVDTIAEWHGEGSALLDQSVEGGEAYFRMESSRGEEVLESLSSRVELSKVADILRMYGKALTGADVAVHSAEALAEKGIGWVETEAPSTEGSSIFLPPHIEEFTDKEQNFACTRCTARPGGPPRVRDVRVRVRARGGDFPPLRHDLEAQRVPPAAGAPPPLDSDGHVDAPGEGTPIAHVPLTDMERFFDLFPDRRLASDCSRSWRTRGSTC